MENARCPAHPDQKASGTCLRCGRFVCNACGGAELEVRCPTCQHRTLEEIPPGGGAAKVAYVFLIANGLLHLVVSFGFSGNEAPANLLVGLAMVASAFLLLGTLIGAAVPYLIWMHRTVRTGLAMGINVDATPGWAVGYWFIPFVNLVRPYRIVSALAHGLGGKAKTAPVGPWWALWIGGNMLSSAGSRGQLRVLDGVSAVALACAAVACIVVMSRIQAELDAARSTAARAASSATAALAAPAAP